MKNETEIKNIDFILNLFTSENYQIFGISDENFLYLEQWKKELNPSPYLLVQDFSSILKKRPNLLSNAAAIKESIEFQKKHGWSPLSGSLLEERKQECSVFFGELVSIIKQKQNEYSSSKEQTLFQK